MSPSVSKQKGSTQPLTFARLPVWLDQQELADFFRLSIAQVLRMLLEGRGPRTTLFGSHEVVSREDLIDWVEDAIELQASDFDHVSEPPSTAAATLEVSGSAAAHSPLNIEENQNA